MTSTLLLPAFRLACVFVAGIISALAMAPTFYWPFLLVGFSAFYIFYAGTKSWKGAALLGFAFSLGYHVHGLLWVGNALLVDGNTFRWVWPLSVIGLPCLLSVFSALFAGLSRKFSEPSRLSGFLFLTMMLALSEWTRGHIFSGFPWNLYGHAWISNLPMLQIVNVIGMYSLTLVTIIWMAFPGYLLVSNRSINTKAMMSFLVLASILGVYLYGSLRLNGHPTRYDMDTSIRVVQPNIRQDLKWKPELMGPHFMELLSLSKPYNNASKDADHKTYIVWPETAMPPQVLDSIDAGQAIQSTLASFPHDAYLLSGALRIEASADGKRSYFNSLLVLDDAQEGLAIYDKSHLVPFGEYIPLQRFIPLQPVVKFNGFVAGDGSQTIMMPSGQGITPLICYEVIFPGMAKGGQQRADMIVNITNDAWYGLSAGPHQHFMQTIVRAVEFGLPVIRAANTGISGIIDPYGRVLARTDLFQKSALTNPLPQKTDNKTLYARVGDAPLLLYAGLLILLFFFAKRSFLSFKP